MTTLLSLALYSVICVATVTDTIEDASLSIISTTAALTAPAPTLAESPTLVPPPTAAPSPIAPVSPTVPVDLYPNVEAGVDKNEIYIGDDFKFTVIYTHKPEIAILEKGRNFNLGQFEIKDIQPQPDKILENKDVQETTVYTLSTYFTGDFEIPAIDIRFRTKDGRDGTLKTSPIKIKVKSLTPEKSENLDIRDIKNPLVVSGKSRTWIVVSVVSLIIFFLFLIYWLWWRKHHKSGENTAPPLPSHLLAYKRLEELRQRQDLVEQKQYKEFSSILSDIVRVYIKQRWFIEAPDLTTEEISNELHFLKLGEEINQLFFDVFESCDMIKFAKHEPQLDELGKYIDIAVRIVDCTKPQEPGSENNDKPNQDKNLVTADPVVGE